MSVPAQRDAHGRLLPGFTGNPGGRPKGAGLVREMAKSLVPAAMAKIGALIDHPDARVALAASQEVINRFAGRPVQAVAAEVTKLDATKLYLEALKRVNGIVDMAPTLDLMPTPDDEPEMEALPSPDDGPVGAGKNNPAIEW